MLTICTNEVHTASKPALLQLGGDNRIMMIKITSIGWKTGLLNTKNKWKGNNTSTTGKTTDTANSGLKDKEQDDK